MNKIEKWLEENLYDILYDEKTPKVEQYDFSYLEQLGWIFYEKFGPEEGREKLIELNYLLNCNIENFQNTLFLNKKFAEIGIFKDNFSPRKSTDEFKTQQHFKENATFNKVENKSINDVNINDVNLLQAEYSSRSLKKPYSGIFRPETGDVWTLKIKEWIQSGDIDINKPCLSVGCRWVDEIKYFRSIGLKQMIGLDLFSQDDFLVKKGDIHNLSYLDNTFSLIYQRNTFDKLFDVRQAFGECIRSLSSGGIFIYDDIQCNTKGVNELTRTNISNNEWIIQHLNARRIKYEILYNKQVEANAPYCKFIGLFAFKILK